MSLCAFKLQHGPVRRTTAASPRPSRTAIAVCASAGVNMDVANVTVSRRTLLMSGFAGLCTSQLLASPANADTAEQGVEEYSRLEASGKLNTAKALENIRAKYNFKRGADGRVYLKGEKGNYFAVRLDMEVPGAMLFRDTASGQVFALQTEMLQQIDLSSDQVVILLLGDGDWEREMSPITLEDEKGDVKTLTLSETDFRNVVGLISQAGGGAEGDEKNK